MSKKKSRTAVQSVFQLIAMKPKEMRRLPKPRDGFEAFVAPLAELYRQEPKELGIVGLRAEDLLNGLARHRSLVEATTTARRELAMMEETRLLEAAKLWRAILEVYAKAQAAARTNSRIKGAIADFTRFMATGPRRRKAPNGPAAQNPQAA